MVGAPRSPASSPRGVIVDIFHIDGGHSWTSSTASQGGAIDISCVDGGRSRISSIDSQGPAVDVSCVDGGRSRIPDIASQGGPTVDVLQLSGSHFQTSSNASQGVTMSRTFFNEIFLGPCAAKDLER
jgi:hypothetical protein